MNSLVKSLIFPLLESEQKGVALIPGGFKPPTIGHFVLVDEVAQNPNFDKVIVLIGHKVRDGVTKEESLAVWDIYKKYLPSNVEIKISDNSSPIADISSLIKNNPDTYFYPVVGIRGEMDLGDIKRFDSLEGKYPNFKTIVIKSNEGKDRVSGTNTRAALIGGDKDKFQSYLPTELSQEEKDGVWSWGLTLSNIGPKITYNSAQDLDYIPTTFRAGTAYKINVNPTSSLTFALDANKLLVPTPPTYKTNADGTLATDASGNLIIDAGKDPNRALISGMFGSLNDAPDGFKEELSELTLSFGVEYLYANKFALRSGYFYEDDAKGGRRYFTMGGGFTMKRLGLDFSYLVPQVQNHPLAETLRFSLRYSIASIAAAN